MIARDTEKLTGPEGQTRSVSTVTWVEYPNRVRVETTLPTYKLAQAFTGVFGWAEDPRGVHLMPEPVVAQLKASLARDPASLLVAASQGKLKMRMLAPTRDEADRPLQVLEVETSPGDPTIVYFDADARVVRLSYSGAATGAERPLIEERFSDFRAVDGLQVAFRVNVLRGGKPLMERALTSVEVNPDVPFRTFLPPRPPKP